MTSLNNKYTNNRSMNGLISIYADSIESNDSVVNDSLIVDGKDINTVITQVDTNKTNLTGITYSALPTPTTKIVNNLDLTGTMTIRHTTDPTIYNMSVYFDPAYSGFRFLNNQINGYMYFSVKDPYNPSQFKNFQFQASQVYTDIPLYVNNTSTISYNNNFVLGDSNTSVWYGASIKYVPNTAVNGGLCFYNKAFNNAPSVYYTNFTHNDMTNTEIPTFRMNYANIWSKVKHIFDQGAEITGNLTVSGVLDATGTTYLQATTISGALTSNFFSYFTKDINLTSTAKLYVNGTTGITQNELSYLSGVSSNIQTQLNNKLNLTGGTISGASTILNLVNTASTTSTPDMKILNQSSARGLNFISNSVLNAMNNFVGANEAVIGTNSQNSSSLVLTTSNSTLDYGIRILSNTSTSATITTRVSNNSIITNQTGHTINGPITFATTAPATFSNSGTNFPFGFSVGGAGGGDINMTRTDTLYNGITSDSYIAIRALQNHYWSDNHYFRMNGGGTISNTDLNIHGNITFNSGSSGTITFSDSTQQTTAYTSADDAKLQAINNTKLQAIGTTVIGTLTTSTLTSGTFYSAGSISLSAGTWIINTNSCFTVITGSTTVGQLLTCPSTSSTAISATSRLSINHINNQTCGVGVQWVLTSSNIYTPTSTTTYYCLVQAGFGTASRLQFLSTNSRFEAYRIA